MVRQNDAPQAADPRSRIGRASRCIAALCIGLACSSHTVDSYSVAPRASCSLTSESDAREWDRRRIPNPPATDGKTTILSAAASPPPVAAAEQVKNSLLKTLSEFEHQMDPTSAATISDFVRLYLKESNGHVQAEECAENLRLLLKATEELSQFQFPPVHKAKTYPLDFHKLGNDIFRPLVDLKNSQILGKERFDEVAEKLRKGENVIFFSNHQSEADPQVMSLVLEHIQHADLSMKMTCVAGHRVTSDPLSKPFSIGRNLICINSKRHMINVDSATLNERMRQNVSAMNALGGLLEEGGVLLWVAPSGGRDRPDSTGYFQVAPFDDKAVKMFLTLTKRSAKNHPSHFYPLSLLSYPVLPPPPTVASALGEVRKVSRSPVGVFLGKEILPSPRLGPQASIDLAKDAEDAVVTNYHTLHTLLQPSPEMTHEHSSSSAP